MKKIYLIVALLLSPLAAQAQTQVQGLIGEEKKIVAEHSLNADKIFAYSYLEATDDKAAYWQAITEYNVWKVAAHAEFRTSFDGWRAAFAGVSYPIISKNGLFSVAALVRLERGLTTWQIGTSNSYDFGRIDIYGYTDLWYDKGLAFFWEQRAYVNLTKAIGLGVVFDTAYQNKKATFTPYIGVRIKFN